MEGSEEASKKMLIEADKHRNSENYEEAIKLYLKFLFKSDNPLVMISLG